MKSAPNKSTSRAGLFGIEPYDDYLRHYQVTEPAATSKKEINNASGKGLLPAIPLSFLRIVPASVC